MVIQMNTKFALAVLTSFSQKLEISSYSPLVEAVTHTSKSPSSVGNTENYHKLTNLL